MQHLRRPVNAYMKPYGLRSDGDPGNANVPSSGQRHAQLPRSENGRRTQRACAVDPIRVKLTNTGHGTSGRVRTDTKESIHPKFMGRRSSRDATCRPSPIRFMSDLLYSLPTAYFTVVNIRTGLVCTHAGLLRAGHRRKSTKICTLRSLTFRRKQTNKQTKKLTGKNTAEYSAKKSPTSASNFT